MYCSSLNAGY
jgi:hypothetical protein